MIPKLGRALLVLFVFLAATTLAQAQSQSLLTRHVRDVTRTGEAARLANLPPIQTMHLVLVLPLRNQSDLDELLRNLYEPTSPEYRQFLSVDEFTARFAPTQQDYNALIDSHRKTASPSWPLRAIA